MCRAAQALGAEMELIPRLERVLAEARHVITAGPAGVALVTEPDGDLEIVATNGGFEACVGMRLPRGRGMNGAVILANAPLRVGDVAVDPNAAIVGATAALEVRSWLGVPLADANGAFGVLSVSNRDPNAFDAEDERWLSALAALATVAVREWRLRQHAQRELERREGLLRMSRRLAAEAEPDALLAAALSEAVTLLVAEGGVVTRLDPERMLLTPVLCTIPGVIATPTLEFGIGAGGLAATRRQTVILNDYQAEIGDETLAGQSGVRAAMAVPLLHEGRLLGTITVSSYDPQKRFSAEDLEPLELLAAILASTIVGLERSRLEGALLAARTATHHGNNALSLTVGYAELLAVQPDLPASLRPMALEALRGAREAAETLEKLQRIARLEKAPGPLGLGIDSVLDLERSSAPPPSSGVSP